MVGLKERHEPADGQRSGRKRESTAGALTIDARRREGAAPCGARLPGLVSLSLSRLPVCRRKKKTKKEGGGEKKKKNKNEKKKGKRKEGRRRRGRGGEGKKGGGKREREGGKKDSGPYRSLEWSALLPTTSTPFVGGAKIATRAGGQQRAYAGSNAQCDLFYALVKG